MESGFAKFGVLAVTGLSLVAAGIFLGREIDIDAEPATFKQASKRCVTAAARP
ncbi:hypothetical protein HF313_05630 [Massilia atriviolacea]|uniref:hypothetical protein n=1 Tax=Massilia atriviolacea TaxID=2495579 RepID=UPI0013DF58E9|nr:hypothetical protein [Massilia atriviolacea]